MIYSLCNRSSSSGVQSKTCRMRRAIIFLFLILFLACDDSDKESVGIPLVQAGLSCGQDPKKMLWIQELISQSESDLTGSATIYVSQLKGEAVFVYQPMVASCWACLIYDCSGQQVPRETLDQNDLNKIVDGMRAIYNPY